MRSSCYCCFVGRISQDTNKEVQIVREERSEGRVAPMAASAFGAASKAKTYVMILGVEFMSHPTPSEETDVATVKMDVMSSHVKAA